MKGLVTDIERYAINDGFGLRTTVFLKGCPLRCVWCCNPETQEPYSEMVFFRDKCIGCGACIQLCDKGAFTDGLNVDRSICKNCYKTEKPFTCVEKCYAQCRKIVGVEMSEDDVFDVVKRDLSFYRRSGGGVTISGGEPLLQPEFLQSLCKKLTDNWISIAIETCGVGNGDDYEKVVPYLSSAFMDIKHLSPEIHKKWTGSSNERILENVIRMDFLAGKYDFNLVYRTPVIPGFNDSEDDIHKICEFVSKNCKYYKGIELLAYHKLGRGKYYSLDHEYPLNDIMIPTKEKMDMLSQILTDHKIPIYQF